MAALSPGAYELSHRSVVRGRTWTASLKILVPLFQLPVSCAYHCDTHPRGWLVGSLCADDTPLPRILFDGGQCWWCLRRIGRPVRRPRATGVPWELPHSVACVWAREPRGCFDHYRCLWHRQKSSGPLFYFLITPSAPAPTGPQNLQTSHQCDLISITPSCILFFLGCLVFFSLLFLSLFGQHWNCVELATQSRGSGCFGIGLGGFLRGTGGLLSTPGTHGPIFFLCVSCAAFCDHF